MIGLFKKWLDYMNIVSDIYPLLQPFNSYVEGGGQQCVLLYVLLSLPERVYVCSDT